MRVFVVGGGISGLATAFRIRERFEKRGVPLDLRVLEAEDRLGGKIRSEQAAGYLMEWGPNGFLDSKPHTLSLCRDLHLDRELLPSDPRARKRFIFSRGRLHRVPETPGAFFRSPLLTVRGRIRIVKELWAGVTPVGSDTSVAEFGRRRLGPEAVEKLLDPMVSGIFAGDPQVMSLEACFPRILELERQYGSLVRAMVSLMREHKRLRRAQGRARQGDGSALSHKAAPAGPAGPGGTLTSFAGGMEQLVAALAKSLDRLVLTGSPVLALLPERSREGAVSWRIRFRREGEEREEPADAVVLAVPAYQAAVILASVDSSLSEGMRAIPYSPIVVVGLGFPRQDAPGSLDGFGFLIPHAEGTPVLGSLWSSSIFPARAPEGCVLTRNMVGGFRNPWVVERSDAELEALVTGVLERALGTPGKLAFRKVVRHPKGIPLYPLGHVQRLKDLDARASRFPGLYITGNAFRGVALNDCTREAERIAARVEEDLLGGTQSPQ